LNKRCAAIDRPTSCVNIIFQMASVSTRSATEHSILGQPAAFCKNKLPTSADVFRAYDYCVKTAKASTVHERATFVAEEVKEIYDKASIPTTEVSSIVIRIKRLITKVQELGKYPDAKRSSATFKENLQSLENVFDICACKCFDSGARDRSACKCPLVCKIPAIEWEFWIDQKTTRRMFIGQVDKETTVKLQKKEKRSKISRSSCADKKLKCDTEVNLSEPEISEEENVTTDEELSMGEVRGGSTIGDAGDASPPPPAMPWIFLSPKLCYHRHPSLRRPCINYNVF